MFVLLCRDGGVASLGRFALRSSDDSSQSIITIKLKCKQQRTFPSPPSGGKKIRLEELAVNQSQIPGVFTLNT